MHAKRGPHRFRQPIPLLAALVVVLLIAGGVLDAVGPGGSGSNNGAQAAVIDAVDTSFAASTAHVSMTETGSGAASFTMTGSGDIDFANNAMQLQATINAGGQSETISYVYVGDTIYVQIPQISDVLPGKSWVSLDLTELAKAAGTNALPGGPGNNPVSMLHLLAQQGNTVLPLGSSTIDGVAVQGYEIDINPAAVESELQDPNLPAWMRQAVSQGVSLGNLTNAVYIDGSGLLRRTTNSITETVESHTFTVQGEADYSDYGESVSISAPPADQVASFDDLIQSAGSSG